MTAIATLSGRVIDFLNPDPAQFILGDIAAGLAAQPRYTGQTVRAWSVAQHCLLVASLVEPQHRLHALLHDAPEAYACDLPSPLKEAMRQIAEQLANIGALSHYDAIEDNLWRAICRRYDISPVLPEEVRRADRTAMVIEAPILQPRGWRNPVWDFAREEEQEIGGVHRETFLRISAAAGGGKIFWLLAVVDELARRKAES